MGQSRRQRVFKDILAKFITGEWPASPLAMMLADAMLHGDESLLRYALRRMREVPELPDAERQGELVAFRACAASAISQRNPGETVSGQVFRTARIARPACRGAAPPTASLHARPSRTAS